MTTQQKIYISAAAVASVAMVALLIYYFENMKQSIKGFIGESYFSIEELSHSETAIKNGIDNTPPEDVKTNLQALIDNVLDPVRKAYGSFIKVNCGYRCPQVNALVGGVSTSQHLVGQAADITGGSVDKNKSIFQAIVNHGKYDQLIWEKGGQWIHVSFKSSGSNRSQMLSWNGSKYTNINSNWQEVVLA